MEEIVVSTEVRRELLKMACEKKVRDALKGRSKTLLSLNIRQRAMELGGKKWQ